MSRKCLDSACLCSHFRKQKRRFPCSKGTTAFLRGGRNLPPFYLINALYIITNKMIRSIFDLVVSSYKVRKSRVPTEMQSVVTHQFRSEGRMIERFAH
jgi:hypothetical protein